ncbi:VanZ family protein [Streptomyces sp. MBT56]|uniref:VanZ family protein n=1 Tax=unclassified Streptomyces TaxID=2593676 RepID=UPI001909C010|nr:MULTISPECIES: VanZ family protein [unclassified Streptomyces]MBK3556156.1 VanZ family protein [Streptomyces sp. MBT56]MBK3605373.1 VanZ family protein [Streptomyces sp. MBT54]MBK3618932.1 VanZ family protein [Streptomyces sp. MBT98]
MLVRGLVLAAALVGLVAFSVLLAKVTLTPSPASEDIVTSNLQPGRSLRQYAEDYTFLAACKQAGGNVLLGVPFGLLLPFFVPRRLRMIRTVLLAAVAMAVVELIQGALVQGRAFDIDDVILNTTGALLGYFVLGRRISHRYYTYAEVPRTPEQRDEPEPTPEPKRTAGKAPGTKPAWRKADGTKTADTKARGTKTASTKTAGAKTAGSKAAAKKATSTKATGAKAPRPLLDRLRGR